MLQVELDIFSGRSNPSWMLSPTEERTLIDRIAADESLIFPVDIELSRLGYRGFIVRNLIEDDGSRAKSRLPSEFRLVTGVDPDAALWMLRTSEKRDSEVDDYLRGVVHEEVVGGEVSSEKLLEKGPGQSCVSNYLTSSTDFSFWNGSSHVTKNNCYNFASNYRSGTFAQPGTAGGNPITSASQLYCGPISSRVRADGYADYCLGGSARNISIVLVIWPGNDFHFYRLCSGGRWCHKAGTTPATNRDNSNNFIYNPANADRGPYSDVCGYFFADRSMAV